MYNSNLKIVQLQVSKDNPYEEVVPEGYVRIVHRENSLFPWRVARTQIYSEGESIKLTSGSYTLTTIKINQEVEIFKIVDLESRSNFKSKSKSIMLVIRANYTEATTVACKVQKTYGCNDPGFCNELESSIDRVVYKVSEAMRDISDANIKKAEELLIKSVKLIADKYALANLSVKFETFD